MKPLLALLFAIGMIGCATHGIDIRNESTDFTPPVIQGNSQSHDSVIYRMVPAEPTVVHDTVRINGVVTITNTVHDTVRYVRKIYKVWKDTLITEHRDTLRHSLDTYTGRADWYGVQQAYKVQYVDTSHWDKPADVVKFGLLDKIGLGVVCMIIGAILMLIGITMKPKLPSLSSVEDIAKKL